jgi:Helix-turn-helix domain
MSEDFRKPFIPIWMDQAGFTPHQFRVLAHLWSRGQGTCFPSLDTIAKCCGIRRGTVCDALKALELAGCVTRVKRKTKGIRFANEYLLTGTKGAPVKNEPGRKEHRVTGTDKAPGNRDVWSTGNDTSMNDASMNKSKETKETSFSEEKEVCDFSAIPSKDEQLSKLAISKRIVYPTEEEFEQYIQEAELDHVVNGRPCLWDDLRQNKWHHWNPTKKAWHPIRHWAQYVVALDNKMNDACGL